MNETKDIHTVEELRNYMASTKQTWLLNGIFMGVRLRNHWALQAGSRRQGYETYWDGERAVTVRYEKREKLDIYTRVRLYFAP